MDHSWLQRCLFFRKMRERSVSLCKPCQPHLTQETESSGRWRQAPTTSDEDGVSPSHTRAGRFSRRDRAQALAAAQARMEDQRWWHACRTHPASTCGADLALALANWLTNARASSDHLPPTSAARTTRRACPWANDNSG